MRQMYKKKKKRGGAVISSHLFHEEQKVAEPFRFGLHLSALANV